MKISELRKLTEESYKVGIKKMESWRALYDKYRRNDYLTYMQQRPKRSNRVFWDYDCEIERNNDLFVIKAVEFVKLVNEYFEKNNIGIKLNQNIKNIDNDRYACYTDELSVELINKKGKKMQLFNLEFDNTRTNLNNIKINVIERCLVKSYISAIGAYKADLNELPKEFQDAVWFALGENYKKTQIEKIESNKSEIKELKAKMAKLANENIRSEIKLKNSSSDLEL